MKRISILVYGRVQGVFFRQKTREKAASLQITGSVRNLSDGTVQIQAQGTEQNVEELRRWAKRGPALAKVDRIVTKELEVIAEQQGFELVR